MLKGFFTRCHALFAGSPSLSRSGRIQLKWLNVEFSSKCNLRCKWCTLDHTKPAVHLDEALFSKLLDEVCDGRTWDVGEIALHNAGEILLHPRLAAMLKLIAGKRRGTEPFPIVSLLTNGVLLNRQKAAELLDSHALDSVRFSLDGGSATEFEEIRRGAKWNVVRDNVLGFVDLNTRSARKVRTGILCMVSRDKPLSAEWMDADFRSVLQAVDFCDFRHPHNWDGSSDLGFDPGLWDHYREEHLGRVCEFLQNDLVLLPDGRVTVCCNDLNARGVIGNLRRDTLIEIYNSKTRRDMIGAFLAKDQVRVPLCKDCSGYY